MHKFFSVLVLITALGAAGCSRTTGHASVAYADHRGPAVVAEVAEAQVDEVSASSSRYPAPYGPSARRGKPRCAPGSVFIREVDGCVRHVTDRAEIGRVMPPELRHDPNCAGKPAGYRYDKPVTGPRGERGVAHIVCGRRP